MTLRALPGDRQAYAGGWRRRSGRWWVGQKPIVPCCMSSNTTATATAIMT